MRGAGFETAGGLGGGPGVGGRAKFARGDSVSVVTGLYLKVDWRRYTLLATGCDTGGWRAAPKQHHIRHHMLMSADGTRTPITHVPDMADGVKHRG